MIALSVNSVSAQDSLFSLQRIWEQAELYNKEFQLKKTDLLKSNEQVLDAKTGLLPEVNVSGSYGRLSDMPLYQHGLFNGPKVVAVNSTSYNAGVEATMTLYNGGKLTRDVEIRKTQLSSMENIQLLTLAEIKLKSAKYFFDLIRNEEFKHLVEKEITHDHKLLKDISSLYKNGTVLKSDVLRADLKLSNHQMLLTEIKNNITLATQQLNIIMGRSDDDSIIPNQPVNAFTNLDLLSYDDYLSLGMSQAYELRIAKDNIAIQKLQTKQINADILPKLSVYTGYSYNYPQSKYYPYADAIYGIGQIGLKLNMPLSNLYLTKHKRNMAKLSLENQVTLEEIKEDQIRNDIKTNYVRYTEALERIEVAKKSIVQSTEALRILTNSYFNQQSLLTDLLDAETQLLQAQFDLTAAQVGAQIQYYQLERIIGKI